MPSDKTAVITTINKIEETFIDKIVDYGYECVIAGDLKTPSDSYQNKQHIDYIEAECKVFNKLSKKLPFNHYCRKNLGYLHAIKKNPSSILDADDDNFPTSDIYKWKELQHNFILGSTTTPNVLKYFSSSNIWARGYPLELINKNQSLANRDANNSDLKKVGVVQSLVNGDPDVDAIFRLTSKEYSNEFKFKEGMGCIFKKGIYSQGNTQATLWVDPNLFHLLYIPVTVSFRFCDILKMYVTQRCMWEYDSLFAVTSPFFHQTRNAHDYMTDFKSEVSMYKCLHNLLVNILPSVKLKGDVEDIIRVYEVLSKNSIVKNEELITLKLFLDQL